MLLDENQMDEYIKGDNTKQKFTLMYLDSFIKHEI